MSDLTPVQEHYSNKVKQLYSVYKPDRVNDGSVEKLVKLWPPGSEERRFQALQKKYSDQQQMTTQGSTTGSGGGSSYYQAVDANRELSPTKQEYVRKVNELYAQYRPEKLNTGSAETVVRSWKDGSEETGYRVLCKKYGVQNAALSPIPTTTYAAASHYTGGGGSSSTNNNNNIINVGEQQYNTNTATATAAQKSTQLYSTNVQPSANAPIAQPGVEYNHNTSTNNNVHYTNNSNIITTPAPAASDFRADGTRELSPTKQEYVRKMNALYAQHRPEKANTGHAEKLVGSWSDGTEEQAYQVMLQKYSPQGTGMQQSTPQTYVSSSNRDQQIDANTTTSYTHTAAPTMATNSVMMQQQPQQPRLTQTQQRYAEKVNALYVLHDPERAGHGHAERVVESWPEGSEESSFQYLQNHYAPRSSTTTTQVDNSYKPNNNAPMFGHPSLFQQQQEPDKLHILNSQEFFGGPNADTTTTYSNKNITTTHNNNTTQYGGQPVLFTPVKESDEEKYRNYYAATVKEPASAPLPSDLLYNLRTADFDAFKKEESIYPPYPRIDVPTPVPERKQQQQPHVTIIAAPTGGAQRPKQPVAVPVDEPSIIMHNTTTLKTHHQKHDHPASSSSQEYYQQSHPPPHHHHHHAQQQQQPGHYHMAQHHAIGTRGSSVDQLSPPAHHEEKYDYVISNNAPHHPPPSSSNMGGGPETFVVRPNTNTAIVGANSSQGSSIITVPAHSQQQYQMQQQHHHHHHHQHTNNNQPHMIMMPPQHQQWEGGASSSSSSVSASVVPDANVIIVRNGGSRSSSVVTVSTGAPQQQHGHTVQPTQHRVQLVSNNNNHNINNNNTNHLAAGTHHQQYQQHQVSSPPYNGGSVVSSSSVGGGGGGGISPRGGGGGGAMKLPASYIHVGSYTAGGSHDGQHFSPTTTSSSLSSSSTQSPMIISPSMSSPHIMTNANVARSGSLTHQQQHHQPINVKNGQFYSVFTEQPQHVFAAY